MKLKSRFGLAIKSTKNIQVKKGFILVFVIFLLSNTNTFGQMRADDDSLKHFRPKLSLGIGVGFSNMFGDFSTSVPAPAARLGIGWRITNNLIAGVETYFGRLSSKQYPVSWSKTGFSETSTFESADLNAKITLGNYLQYPDNMWLKILSGIYVGTGIGYVNSTITSFKGSYISSDLNNKLDSGSFTRHSVLAPYIPVNIGLRIHMKKFLGTSNTQFMLNYQMNYTFSDYVDGYHVQSTANGSHFYDCYTVLTFGLSFRITKY